MVCPGGGGEKGMSCGGVDGGGDGGGDGSGLGGGLGGGVGGGGGLGGGGLASVFVPGGSGLGTMPGG